jgi:hypothetical protein
MTFYLHGNRSGSTILNPNGFGINAVTPPDGLHQNSFAAGPSVELDCLQVLLTGTQFPETFPNRQPTALSCVYLYFQLKDYTRYAEYSGYL